MLSAPHDHTKHIARSSGSSHRRGFTVPYILKINYAAFLAGKRDSRLKPKSTVCALDASSSLDRQATSPLLDRRISAVGLARII